MRRLFSFFFLEYLITDGLRGCDRDQFSHDDFTASIGKSYQLSTSSNRISKNETEVRPLDLVTLPIQGVVAVTAVVGKWRNKNACNSVRTAADHDWSPKVEWLNVRGSGAHTW